GRTGGTGGGGGRRGGGPGAGGGRPPHDSTGERVAIKLLRDELASDPKIVMRFVQERAILTALSHPNVVRVRDLLTVGSSLGLVMDLVPGGSLRDRLRERRTLPPSEAAAILTGVAAALAEAHRQGIVHRDLKPDNVLLERPEGSDPQARLTDFGVARIVDSPGLTTTGALVGTPNYLAPEVIDGREPTPATDVYAFGVLLYELLVGRPPYAGGPSAAVLSRHLEHVPRRYDGIADAMWQVIEACTRKAPDRRPTAADLVDRMRALVVATAGLPALTPLPAEAPAVSSRPPSPRHARRGTGTGIARRALPAVLIAACLALAGGALFSQRDSPPSRAEPRRAPPPDSAPASPAPRPPAATATAAAARRPAALAQAADRDHRPEANGGGYGPWRCGRFAWSFGQPAMAQPCHAIGPAVRLSGKVRALAGARIDVTLRLVDAATGRAVAGPFRCDGLTFTDRARERTCGGFEATPARGRRYNVVLTWQVPGQTRVLPGTARGEPFDW
ncbi:serine/threonine protein kinase, partial [Micromonospora sp. CPCC 205371]|nr:serine/threonine protein kinase [Micromonospora sp. CPCC 205371]